AASGSYPTSIPSEQEIAPLDRYRDFVEYAGPSARRQGVSGLHVHIGMPDADSCFRVMETILPWLPLVLALSANSPYFERRDTGMLSIRAEVLGLLPRHGAPPAFRDYAGWEAFIDRVTASGLARDYTSFWWDVRLHPRFGTLEIRAPDQPTSIEQTAGFVRFLRTLCALVALVSFGAAALVSGSAAAPVALAAAAFAACLAGASLAAGGGAAPA